MDSVEKQIFLNSGGIRDYIAENAGLVALVKMDGEYVEQKGTRMGNALSSICKI